MYNISLLKIIAIHIFSSNIHCFYLALVVSSHHQPITQSEAGSMSYNTYIHIAFILPLMGWAHVNETDNTQWVCGSLSFLVTYIFYFRLYTIKFEIRVLYKNTFIG
jgi:exosortase/archaeosortase